MAAPRSTSLRALRTLSQHHTPATTLYCRRRLHITGAFSAQPVDGSDKAAAYGSRTLADLKNECQRRGLRTAGSKPEVCQYELIQRGKLINSSSAR
jgi:SAP domain